MAEAPADAPGREPEVAAGRGLAPHEVLQITTENGVCYLDLSAGADGPIRMPLEKEGFPAVLISTRHEGETLIVTMAAESAELETEPAGRYELVGSDDFAQAEVPAAKSQPSVPWELRRLPAAKAMPGCCSGSVAKIQCCPNAGKCLSCSTCGQGCG